MLRCLLAVFSWLLTGVATCSTTAFKKLHDKNGERPLEMSLSEMVGAFNSFSGPVFFWLALFNPLSSRSFASEVQHAVRLMVACVCVCVC